MSFQITSKKARIVENIFIYLLSLIIFISCFKPFMAGSGQIGITAKPLEIIDRPFYINDSDPLQPIAKDQGGPLYPKILQGISFISIKLFNQSSTSPLWNSLTIMLSSLLSFLTLRLIYASGKLFDDESTGTVAMAIFAACPYTYIYALSGGLTIYTLFGTSLCTYLILKLNRNQSYIEVKRKNLFIRILISLSLIYMAFLRPSSVIFSFVLAITMILIELINSMKINKNKKLLFINIFLLVIPITIAIHQLIETKVYTINAINAFQNEQGTFMGYSRELIRTKIKILQNSSVIKDQFQGYLYQFIWKINDFFTGIIDIRDTHSPFQESLLPFFARVSFGTFFLAPITYFSLLGTFVFRKYLLSSSLWICLCATFISISPSLMGVSMSRYYFMFITPVILITSFTIKKAYVLSISFDHKEDANK